MRSRLLKVALASAAAINTAAAPQLFAQQLPAPGAAPQAGPVIPPAGPVIPQAGAPVQNPQQPLGPVIGGAPAVPPVAAPPAPVAPQPPAAPPQPAPVIAPAPAPAVTIHAIRVEGAGRIEADTVRSYVSVTEGDKVDDQVINRALKSLFATSLFSDAHVYLDGDTLVIKVMENPIVNRVAFEGNEKIEDKQLVNEVQLKPRQVYTLTKVQEDVQRILDVYRRSGRYAVSVVPKLIQQPQNRVDVVFEIAEGASTTIRRINFIGAKNFSTDDLREAISSREQRWYRFLSNTDTYDPDRLNYDTDLLRRFYLRHGYSDFRLVSSVAELTPDRTGFYITFTIEEGERYKFGNLSVTSGLKDVSPESLTSLINASKGDWYNADQVENTVQKITAELGARGYPFVDVRPRVHRDAQKHIIDITFDVQEGARIYVEKIDITGNVRTLDKVIRREMLVAEGDAFNAARVRRSKERINNLGFFSKVDVTNTPSETTPDRTVVHVAVEEQSTGSLSFGGGYSTSLGPLLNVGFKEKNILGTGTEFHATGLLAVKGTQIDVGITKPYLFDRRITGSFDVFDTGQNLQTQSQYNLSQLGTTAGMTWSYNEYLNEGVAYTFAQTTVNNVASTASLIIQQEQGVTYLSQIGHTMSYDRRDSTVNPTEGYLVGLGADFAGLGGTEKFVRGSLTVSDYYPVADKMVLSLKTSVGAIQGYEGVKVRFNRDFFLGGDNLRGFADAGAAARDPSTGDALGGTWMATATGELHFPSGLPEELGIGTLIFTDVGAAGRPNVTGTTVVDANPAPRVSAGAGFTWKSPLGPLTVSLGYPIVRENYDKTQYFRFDFGAKF